MNINDINDPDPRPRDGDYRNDDERPQIVQLNTTDLTKEEFDVEIKRAKEGRHWCAYRKNSVPSRERVADKQSSSSSEDLSRI